MANPCVTSESTRCALPASLPASLGYAVISCNYHFITNSSLPLDYGIYTSSSHYNTYINTYNPWNLSPFLNCNGFLTPYTSFNPVGLVDRPKYSMAPLWSYQPFKAIYIFYFIPTTSIYLAALSLRYTLRPLRPLREWSYTTSLGAAVLRYFFAYLATVRYQQPPQMVPGRSKERFVLIQPQSDKEGPAFFTGALAPKIVKPAPVGVVWHPAPLTAPETTTARAEPSSRKGALVFAGGAFVLGWDPEDTGRSASDVLTRHFGATNVLYVQYRLATRETPFPAAVQDALTSYCYALSLGVAPEDIALVGDSAGGNLVIAFSRYLETTATHIPRPVI